MAEISVKQLDEFTRLLYAQGSTKRVAMVASTDGRVISGIDRVSTVLFRGNGSKVLAISHVETVQRRSALVRSMKALGSHARNLSRQIILRGSEDECPPSIEEVLVDFLAESRSQYVAMIPLIPVTDFEDLQNQLIHRKPRTQKPIGLLLVEQFADTSDFANRLSVFSVLAPHIANALKNASDYETLPFLPVWKWVSFNVRWLLGFPKLAICSVFGVLALIALVLWAMPGNYRVHADGKAMPEIQHAVYAAVDGVVKEILVESGAKVRKGDPLLLLENKELELQYIESKNKAIELQAKIASFAIQLEGARQKSELHQELTAEGERAAAQAELEGTQKQSAILEERMKSLTINSDFEGVVVTFQPEEFLRERPVKQGDLLLEVMEVDGPWRLELDIAEYRMGHVLHSLGRSGELSVRYIAMTDVSNLYFGRLSSIATRSDHSEEKGAYVRAYASVDRKDIAHERIGAEVAAKIQCPDYNLFYCLFGDVVEFVQRNVWW